MNMPEVNPKILVVEDDPIHQLSTRLLLEGKGYQIDIAATGKDALSLYKTNSYNAILMDMHLPDIQGIDVTKKIRKIELETGIHTPIIALTLNDMSAKPECLAAGMDDFSTKPFDINELHPLIQSWMKS